MRYYEDFEVGHRTEIPGTYVLSEEEIDEMGGRWGRLPPADPEPAATTVHLFAISVRLGMAGAPVAAVSSLVLGHITDHAPARPGDVVRIQDRVLDKRLSNSNPGMGIVTFVCELMNQHDEAVLSYESAALVRCQP